MGLACPSLPPPCSLPPRPRPHGCLAHNDVSEMRNGSNRCSSPCLLAPPLLLANIRGGPGRAGRTGRTGGQDPRRALDLNPLPHELANLHDPPPVYGALGTRLGIATTAPCRPVPPRAAPAAPLRAPQPRALQAPEWQWQVCSMSLYFRAPIH